MANKHLKITIFATIFLIALGGYTTSSGSGMGCSDVYPLCDSGWLPDFNNPEQFTEWLHRLGAAIVGLFTFLAFFKSFKIKKTRGIAYLSLVLLLVQGALGAFTVKTELEEPVLVFAHLFTSMIFLGSLAIWKSAISEKKENKDTQPFINLSKICAFATFLQILVGAAHVHLAKGASHILITHIIFGFLVTGLSMSAMARARRTSQPVSVSKKSTWAAYLSVSQLILGAGVFLSLAAKDYPIYITGHLMIAAVIWYMHVSNSSIYLLGGKVEKR